MAVTVLKIILGLLLLLAIIVVGNWVISTRAAARRNDLAPVDDLTEFRQMRDAGKIDEEEFRRLKKTISEQTFGISGSDTVAESDEEPPTPVEDESHRD